MCYRFELLEFEDCLFKNVDATYILHLEGNGRIDHIHDQLKTYHPSKKVYIVYNKGYKKCHKDLVIQRTTDDLVHANMTVFEHAQQYKHVLVLEDDFIFAKDVKKYAIHVDDFLKKDTSFVYQLGAMPYFAIPIDMHHCRVSSLTSHANIYSGPSRKHLLDNYRSDKGNIDNIDYYISSTLSVYMYHKPLCYQTFPMTDNRKNWFKNSPPIVSYYVETLFNTFIKWTNLENQPEPGFSIVYFLAKFIPFLLLLLVLWILNHFSYLSCSSLKGRRIR
jgi:hypothetical protein